MVTVPVERGQLRLDLEPCVDAAVAVGEVGQVRAASGVERGGVAEKADPVIRGLDAGAGVVGDHELSRVKAVGDDVV